MEQVKNKAKSNGKSKGELDLVNKIEVLSSLTARMALAGRLGMSYEDARNLYQALGYTTDPTIQDYFAKYVRMDIAKAVIDRPIITTWRGPIELIESNEPEETVFEEAWEDLEEAIKVKSNFVRLDKLTSLGRYGVLLMGFSDVAKEDDFKNPVSGKPKLLYLKAFSEASATISTYEDNVNDPRYGLPLTYQLSVGTEKATKTIVVHQSRVLHVVQGELDSDIEGTPVLEAIYNRLQDLEKIVGGSAEMYWRGARPGYQGVVSPDYTLTPTAEAGLKEKIDEYEHNLRRILVNEGIEMKALEQQVSDPMNAVDVQIQMISAVTGIPKRILVGSERGELASTQDADQWNNYIQTRREEYAEAKIIRPFVDILIKYGVLPEPKEDYTVLWRDLFAPSEKDKADVGRIRAEALAKYTGAMADSVVPPDAFFEFFLGFDADQITLINEMRDSMVIEEEATVVTEEEEEIIEEEETPIPE